MPEYEANPLQQAQARHVQAEKEAKEEARHGLLMMKIADTSVLRVEIILNEVDTGAVRVGMKAHVRLEAYPHVALEGYVARVLSVAEDKNNLRGSLALEHSGAAEVAGVRAFVDLKLNEEQKKYVQLGFSAIVTLELDAPEPVPVLPGSAVRTRGSQAWCFVLRSGRPVRQPLKIGACNEEWVVVKGLAPGAEVLRRWLDAPAWGGSY